MALQVTIRWDDIKVEISRDDTNPDAMTDAAARAVEVFRQACAEVRAFPTVEE